VPKYYNAKILRCQNTTKPLKPHFLKSRFYKNFFVILKICEVVDGSEQILDLHFSPFIAE
jgi:hypothetical protein